MPTVLERIVESESFRFVGLLFVIISCILLGTYNPLQVGSDVYFVQPFYNFCLLLNLKPNQPLDMEVVDMVLDVSQIKIHSLSREQ